MSGEAIGEAFITLRFRPDGGTDGVVRQAEREIGDGGKRAGKSFAENWASEASRIGGSLTRKVTLPILAGVAVAFHEAAEAQKVGGQTAAIIKATGGAAGVTAGEVAGLSARMSEKIGKDDEAIQSGANVVLTFRNIANQAGKGNDIFDRTVKVSQDMAAVMGGDGSSSALQLGKALNSPLTGMTALQRVGVQFTATQKAQIQQYVAAGDLLSAQKIILAEVESEFGGAAAAGATDLDKMGVSAMNLAEGVGNVLSPALGVAADAAGFLTDQFEGLPEWGQQLVGGGLLALAAVGPVMKLAGGVGSLHEKYLGILQSGGATSSMLAGQAGKYAGLAAKVGLPIAGIVGLGLALAEMNESAVESTVSLENIDKVNLKTLREQIGGIREEFRQVYEGAVGYEGSFGRMVADTASFNDIKDKFRDVAGASSEMAQKFLEAAEGSGLSKKEIAALRQILIDETAASRDAATAGKEQNLIVQGHSQAYADAATAVDTFKTALDELAGASTGQEQAQIKAVAAAQALDAAFVTNGATLDINTEKGRANRQAILDSTGAQFAWAQSMIEVSGNTAGANFLLTAQANHLTDVMRAAGLTDEQIHAYLGTLGLLPEQISTLIQAVDNASPVAQHVASVLAAIPRQVYTELVVKAPNNVRAGGAGPRGYQVNFGFGWVDAADGALYSGGVRKMADGGYGREAMVAPGGSNILWAEPETEDESYIPWAQSKRQRSTSILAETANAFGYALTPMADGGSPGRIAGREMAHVGGGVQILGDVNLNVEQIATGDQVVGTLQTLERLRPPR